MAMAEVGPVVRRFAVGKGRMMLKGRR